MQVQKRESQQLVALDLKPPFAHKVLVKKRCKEREKVRDAFRPKGLVRMRFDHGIFGHNAFCQNLAFCQQHIHILLTLVIVVGKYFKSKGVSLIFNVQTCPPKNLKKVMLGCVFV
jgi:hypothetical protein